MTVVAFLLIVVAVVAMVVFLRREVKRAVDKLTADHQTRSGLLDGQQHALYKQGKVNERRVAQTQRAANNVIAEQHKLQKQTRDLHLDVQQILCDPKIQGALRRAHDAEEVA